MFDNPDSRQLTKSPCSSVLRDTQMYEKAVSFLENKIFVSNGYRGWLTLRTAASGISTNPIQLYCIKKGNLNFLHYLVHDTEYNGVNKADSSHSHQTHQEEVGIAVQLEVGGFRIKDGAHQLAFSCAETWVKKRNFWSFLSLRPFLNAQVPESVLAIFTTGTPARLMMSQVWRFYCRPLLI